MTELQPYHARHFAFLDTWSAGATRLKAYLIVRQNDQRELDTLVAMARDYAASALPKMIIEEGHDHQLGYAILHFGEMSNWLLLHWWAHGDIALGHLASFDSERCGFQSQDHRRFHACLWEQVVISHERDAWARYLSAKGRTADDYLNDRLADGLY